MTRIEQRIAELEQLQAQQLAELKLAAGQVIKSISPANLLGSAIRDLGRSPELRTTILDTALGIGAGYLGRKLYVGKSGNLLKQVTGSALELLVSNFVQKKMPEFRQNGQYKTS
jgi:hypothetical protein